MAQKFDKKRFTALIYLLNNIKPEEREKLLQLAKRELTEMKDKFEDIMELGQDIVFRIIAKKGYIKAKQEFERTRNDTLSDYNYTLDRLADLKKRIEAKNRLTSELFTTKIKQLQLNFEELRPNQSR